MGGTGSNAEEQTTEIIDQNRFEWDLEPGVGKEQRELSRIGLFRYEAIDVARGFAIALMFLSHTVKGLMSSSLIPDIGWVPVHLMTKFSSTLFFVVFGVSLRLFFVPAVGTEDWARKRNSLFIRGIEILVIYKILTIVQLYGTRSKQVVIDAMMFKFFPDFVEVLSFYGFALLWLPFFIPIWARLYLPLKVAAIAAMFWGGNWLHVNFDFWGYDAVKTILVEFDGRYTFGQMQRGALTLFGMLLGGFLVYSRENLRGQFPFAFLLLVLSAGSAFLFSNIAGFEKDVLWSIAHNVGKHPPDYTFMTFSLAGALGLFGIVQMFRFLSTNVFKPFSVLGKHSLFAFCFHIVIIFVVLRNTLHLRNQLQYDEVLMVYGGICLLTIFVIWLKDAIWKFFSY